MRASRIAPMIQRLGGGIQLPPDVYVPPPSAIKQPKPGVGLEVGDDFEAFSQAYEWPIGNELTIFTSSRRWRACDVYLDQPNVAPASCFTIRIYAIAPGGQRTLVASGRENSATLVAPPLGPTWIAAARACASRYEVTLTYLSGAGGGVSGERVGVSIVCADQAIDPPKDLGALRLSAVGAPGSLNTTNLDMPELLGVGGINGSGAARYLMLLDSSALPGGRVPNLVWPLGSAAGQGFADYNLRWRTTQGFFWIAASSTPLVCTLAVDCAIHAFVR